MTKKAILLVEGKDDLFVCANLMKHYQVPEVFTIENHEGVHNLLRAHRRYLENTAFDRVGIVVDADEDNAARWQSIRATLVHLRYDKVPDKPDPNGTVVEGITEDRPRAGIWLMPDNQATGILEDFIRFLVPDDDPLLLYAETCVTGIALEHRRYPEVRRPKALIHTWLAWQKEPGSPLGLAISQKYFDADRDHARRFVDWCRRLFVDQPAPA